MPLAGVADEILAVATLLDRAAPAAAGAVGPVPAGRGPGRAARLALSHGKVSEDAAGAAADAGRRPLVVLGPSCSTRPNGSGVEALLASAESAGELAEVEDELFRFGQIVDGDTELAAALGASTAPRAALGDWPTRCSTARPGRPRYGWSTSRCAGFGGRNFAAGADAGWSSWPPTGGTGRSPT